MKRDIGFILVLLACVIAFISLSGTLPFISVFSSADVIIVIIALLIPVVFLYNAEIRRSLSRFHRYLLNPVSDEVKKSNVELSRKIDAAEMKMDTTEQALLQFSSAIADYARHLASHTSAIQGLSQASQELKKGAAEQNRVLSAILENTAQPANNHEPAIINKETPEQTQKIEPLPGEPDETRKLPFHGALYKTWQVKPSYKVGKSIHAAVKPDPANEKPAAEPESKHEGLIIVTRKPRLSSERLATGPTQPGPEIKRLVPVADKLVINACKSIQRPEEKPAKPESLPSHQPGDIPLPPGCARQHEEQLWY